MNKLFGLFILALAFLPGGAEAANRFAVCATTCTWDNSSTAMWSTTSGGATGASAPGSGDAAILDANTCVGGTTCTITSFAGTLTLGSVIMTGFTASGAGGIWDASVNNTNVTITTGSGFDNSGSGNRTINMGSGTWTMSSGSWNTSASATINAGTSTIVGNSAGLFFIGGGKTYYAISLPAISGTGIHTFFNNNIVNTFTITPPSRVNFGNGNTLTVTNLTNVSGTSSNQVLFLGNYGGTASGIISANNFTCDWCGFTYMAFSGGGTFTANNSANYGGNSGITINVPSGGGGKIIGG